MTFAQFVNSLITVGNTIVIPIIFTLTGFVFVYGVLKFFILNGDNEESREQGKQFALWGILGMAVMFSVWGLVNILLSTLGIGGQ